MKRILLGGAILASGLSLCGCSRMTATTEVRSDGSFTRTNVYTMAKAPAPGGPQLSDTFLLPAAAPWKVAKAAGKDDVKVTAVLNVASGQELLRDVSVRRKNRGAVLVTNRVNVAQVAPGRWRYTETLHWNGPAPKELLEPGADVLRQVKLALPANVATDAAAKAVAPGVMRAVWGTLFGPGDSVLPLLLFQPDAAERTLRRRAGRGIEQVLQNKLGDKMTDADRRQATRRLLAAIAGSGKQGGASNAGPEDGTNLPALSFALRVPGRIVATNGETDEYSDDIFWTMYPEAAALGDVTLTAEWDTGKAN